MKQTADFCLEADKSERAEDLLTIARQMWEQLDDDKAADRVERRLEDLEKNCS